MSGNLKKLMKQDDIKELGKINAVKVELELSKIFKNAENAKKAI